MDLSTQLALAPLAHLVGDYLLQTTWMARGKPHRWWPAVVHGIVYTLPFALLTQAPFVLLAISGTHIVIDRFRLARRVIWAVNQVAPKEYRYPWSQARRNEGFALDTSRGLAQALRIVCDNAIHLVINAAALVWLA
ncbi:DUF3307 domain-containing protein [Nonomuraea typhae]|uniref:DUF3307 domain-containing protein n=1 Tax=Nonomuraea typhae TaxID=2603600 RepID=A0ABW7YMR4_9ACTN